jgi:hypothetical protein
VNYFSKWNFEPLEELPPGFCARVWVSHDRVLKVPFQGEERESGLVAALRLQAVGGPKVYEFDESTGTLLMERIVPGTDASDCPDEEVLPQWADTVEGFSALSSSNLLPLSDFVSGAMDAQETCFVHGDLHHHNLLWNGRRFVPIDPKGLAGEPCFEASALLMNPIARIESVAQWSEVVRYRVAWLERRFGWSPSQILDWTLADRGEPGDLEAWNMAVEALRLVRQDYAL